MFLLYCGADFLAPIKDLLHALTFDRADRVARVTGRPVTDRTVSVIVVLGHVRSDPELAEGFSWAAVSSLLSPANVERQARWARFSIRIYASRSAVPVASGKQPANWDF